VKTFDTEQVNQVAWTENAVKAYLHLLPYFKIIKSVLYFNNLTIIYLMNVNINLGDN
jgi:hypothetical protein